MKITEGFLSAKQNLRVLEKKKEKGRKEGKKEREKKEKSWEKKKK
jgi:hypothetical protein